MNNCFVDDFIQSTFCFGLNGKFTILSDKLCFVSKRTIKINICAIITGSGNCNSTVIGLW